MIYLQLCQTPVNVLTTVSIEQPTMTLLFEELNKVSNIFLMNKLTITSLFLKLWN